MSEHKYVVLSFGVEFIRFQRELNEERRFVKELMLELIHNMLYWQSNWSPVKSSEHIMIEEWNATYVEYNSLTNDIFRMHKNIELTFPSPEDQGWGIYDINVLLHNEDYFDVGIRKLGDYRIEQWNNDYGAKLCPNGAIEQSARGSRWHVANDHVVAPRAARRRRGQ